MICLSVIVRNEAGNIVRCLEAAARIATSAVIVDTGSTDGTQDLLRAWAEENDFPLTLIEEPWQNFKVNRTSLMRHAAKSDAEWLLLLDADLVLHVPDPLPDLGSVDVWHGRVDFAHLDYTLPFLVRASKPWFFEGVAHSYLACEEPFDENVMDGLWVEDFSHTTVEKLERDLVALLADHAENPEGTRTVFYLAQTYYDLDRIPEAIIFYRKRAEMGGWDEEVYFSRYRLGYLLCQHVSFADGAQELLRAWGERPNRIEALRALAGSATSVANKTPYPSDRLFVGRPAYDPHEVRRVEKVARVVPPWPDTIGPTCKRKPHGSVLRREDVSVVVVTRGNVDLEPILAPLAWCEDVIVWDNSERDRDYGAFGRYAAIPEAKNPVIGWVDDDVVFERWDDLLALYEPGRLVCNMDADWIEGAGYGGTCGMQGAGSLCDSWLPEQIWSKYLAEHPWDEEALVEADFVFGALVPFTVVDLDYEALPYADGPDRTYTQFGQTQRKHAMIARCRALLAA